MATNLQGQIREMDLDMLIGLAKANIPADVMALLVNGDPLREIAPGALKKAIKVALTTPHEI